jgi:coenzyme Q-binding protein COQ10
MKHVERHRSRHTPAELFDLVVDVEQYPDFVPWVIAARVTGRRDRTLWVEMTMGTSFLRKRFTTVASLDRPHRMEITSHDPLFERFEQIWTFDPAPEGTDRRIVR